MNQESKILSGKEKQHVFIIGSKGIPARYGGFESFVERLTFFQKSKKIQYHVSCMVNKDYKLSKKVFMYNDTECVNIKAIDIGSAKAIIYDINALKYFITYAKKYHIENPIFYILACRIGPFIRYFKKQIEKLKGHLYINPDGHEWKRGKWSIIAKKYWKISEYLMVKHANLIICDSENIEKYIQNNYKRYNPKTIFIPYGADVSKSILSDDDPKIVNWYADKDISPKEYYLIVSRFVPENNYEIMISEFMKSNTIKKLVIITSIENNSFFNKLIKSTNFNKDHRIKFVGTVYNTNLLKKIRENAYGYLHGHEVGGTNPSLLESLASTDLNLLLNVNFNYEVGKDTAMYWNKENYDLAKLIESLDTIDVNEIQKIGMKAKKRIIDYYSWDYIVKRYENVFTNII